MRHHGRRSLSLLALCALVASLVSLVPAVVSPPTAHAQTSTRTVSNLTEADSSTATIASGTAVANTFTTGGTASDRYGLDSVTVHFASGADTAAVQIFEHSSGNPVTPTPNTQFAAGLEKVGTATSGQIQFNAPAGGVTLHGAATYYVVVAALGASAGVRVTTGDNQAGPTGWTIGNGRQTNTTGTTWTAANDAVRFSLTAHDLARSVSNVGQTAATAAAVSTTTLYNSFAVGGTSSDNYTLDSVVLSIASNAANVTAQIYDSSGTDPGSKLGGVLTRSGSASSGNITFNSVAGDITLQGGSTYWLAVTGTSASSPTLGRTSSSAEDASSFTGWSIGDKVVRASGSNYVDAWAESMRFTVNATVQTSTARIISNLAEADSSSVSINPYLANAFTVGGSATDAFTLSSVTVHYASHANNATVAIVGEDAGNPDRNSPVGSNLTQTGSATSGQIEYTATPGDVVLTGGETYYVLITSTATVSTTRPTVRVTTSNGQAAPTGWGIGDGRVDCNGGPCTWTAADDALRFSATLAAVLPDAPRFPTVVNLAETDTGSAGPGAGGGYVATAFTTTGSTGDTYQLAELQFRFPSGASTAQVGIYSNSSGNPGTRNGDWLTFTAEQHGYARYTRPSSGIALSGGTTYFVVVKSSGAFQVGVTSSDDQTSHHRWTIADARRSSSNGTSWTSHTNVMQFSLSTGPPPHPPIQPPAPGPQAWPGRSTVSNLSETTNTGVVQYHPGVPGQAATSFTTGGTTADRYPFTNVVVHFTTLLNDSVTLAIHANHTATLEGETVELPGNKVTDLTKVGSATSGHITFTASGVTLSGGTTYWLVVSQASTATGNAVLTTTTSRNQTGPAGWTIGDEVLSAPHRLGGAILFAVSVDIPPTTVVGNGCVRLQWQYTEEAKWWYYRYYPTTNNIGYGSAWQQVYGFADRVTQCGLVNGVEYGFEIFGRDWSNRDSDGITVKATPNGTHPTRPLAAPANLAVSGGDGQIVARWDIDPLVAPHVQPGSNRYEYRLSTTSSSTGYGPWIRNNGWWADGSGTKNVDIQGRPIDGHNNDTWAAMKLTGLNNGTRYWVQIRTVIGLIWGTPSTAVSVTPNAGQPTGFTATPGPGSATLTFTPGSPSLGSGYVYQYKREHGHRHDRTVTGWNTLSTQAASGGQRTATLTGLTPGQEHQIHIRLAKRVPIPGSDVFAYTALGRAATTTVTPTANAPDAVNPSTISVTHNGTSLTVNWDAPANATAYDVTYYNTTNGRNARAAWNRAGTELTITCDSRNSSQDCVNISGTYTVGVRARNSSGTSAWVNFAPASYSGGHNPPPQVVGCGSGHTQAPGAVTGINVTHNGATLSVSWTAPARAACYDVTYSGNGANARGAWDRSGTSLTIRCDSRNGSNCVTQSGTYTVGIRAKNNAGAGPWVNSAPASYSSGGGNPNPVPVQVDSCGATISSNGNTSGSWNSNCRSQGRSGRNARFYTFTLSSQSEVTINLESGEDPYLYLRSGSNTRSGSLVAENDDIDTRGGNYNSRIVRTLAAGAYTIEATTWGRNRTGSFTLRISGLR